MDSGEQLKTLTSPEPIGPNDRFGLNAPFTHGEIGVLMQKGQDDLLALVNSVIAKMKADGTLRQLHEKYGLIYAY